MSRGDKVHSATRYLLILLVCYLGLWIALAINPVNRGAWLLENLLVFATFLLLGFTHGHFRFSAFSYTLLFLFLVLHAFGAHYTYAKVPVGFWLADVLHLRRNHFDRLIHFAFGLLIVYPLHELLVRLSGAKARWVAALALAVIFALSSFFEIVEAVIAQLVHPDHGSAYLGTQGDIWDAQKDMVAALLGALVATALNRFLPHVAGKAQSGQA